FAIVTLCTLALALGVQPSVIPWGNVVTQVAGGPLSHTIVTSPVLGGLPLAHGILGHPPAAVAVHAAVHAAHPAIVHAGIPAAVHAAHPAVVHAGIPAAIHAAVPAAVHGHAGYVAKTRGAVHTAPLAGHINSVANVNVAPAPGTH
ncbi:hypothetical protein DOY81_008912, partial [Sarcophaga bullata]